MLTLFLFLLSIATVVLGGTTAKDCTIGDQWTDKFIRFECYQGTGTVVKGVRAIGCVPSNTATGSQIQPGSTFDEQYFTYSCSKNGDVVAYQIINCRDSSGKTLAVGATNTAEDGTVWKCYKDDKGAIKLAQDKEGGCLYKGKVYNVGQVWTVDQEFKANVNGVEQLIGKGIGMECKKDSAQGYVGNPFRCITSAGASLASGGFGKANSMNIKCAIASSGAVTMSVVNEEDVTCSVDGLTIQNGQKYTSPDGVNIYKCVYGILTKTACVINGKTYAMNSIVTIGDEIYHCNSGAGMVDFGNIKGCTVSDGSVKKFYSTWKNGTEVQRCTYSVKGGTARPYVEFWGCYMEGRKAIGRNKIVLDGKDLKKCAALGKQYGMRELTTAEHMAYIQSQSAAASSNVIGGSGGSGAGGDLTAEPEEPETSTVTARTTSRTTSTLPEARTTTTTRTPSTTTITTTSKPSTTSTTISTTRSTVTSTSTSSTAQPSTTTQVTTTQKSTTMTVVPTVVFITEEKSTTTTSSTTTAPPVTDQPTTSVPGQCHDLFEMCSTLAPICRSKHTVAVSKLREMVKGIKDDQIKQILSVVGEDKLPTSSEEEKEEMGEVLRGLAGFDEEEEVEDCGCKNDSCLNRCQKRKRKSCKKCQLFKRKIREMVVMMCPTTCDSCGTVGKVPAIVKALVRFYTHDCQ